ncbi:hypothetical protein CEXT_209601 [Caerostris extrusa]|uniref:Ribosomal protein S2 n=1 Tax=Caerostris extrusa TaxID=172846 RepID=A0AAV4S0G3_CAEEX|nr:hypothetical protein CEXT_209601 [Caerostris extrusa]
MPKGARKRTKDSRASNLWGRRAKKYLGDIKTAHKLIDSPSLEMFRPEAPDFIIHGASAVKVMEFLGLKGLPKTIGLPTYFEKLIWSSVFILKSKRNL